MPSGLVVALAGAVAVYLLLRALLRVTQDSREPPMIETAIPFLSPVLGMGSKKAGFYSYMRDKYHLPIYTLRMPGSKLYVINSTALIPVVQRQHRTIAFGPIAAKAARYVMGCSATSDEIINLDPAKDEGYLLSFSKAMHQVMAPGPHLDAMNRVSVQGIAQLLDKLQQQTASATPRTKGETLRLFEWTRHSILRITTDAVYGPRRNPFRDASMEEAWHRFEPGIILLMIGGILPSLLAQDTLKARQELVSHFERYFSSDAPNDPDDDTSKLVRARLDHSRSFSISFNDISRFELGNAFAILSNTLPTAFWVLFHIYSDERVLSEIREELDRIVVVTTTSSSSSSSSGEAGPVIHTIDANSIKASCPLLLSTFREVLRYHGAGASARVVLEDHLLDGKYLLKKGNMVMIPGGVQHTDPSVWGPDVQTFNHRRFVKTDHPASQRRPSPVAFRGFGGGTVLCPGRHFASTEILVFVALMVLRFDLRPVVGIHDGKGKDKRGNWPAEPTVNNSPLAGTIPTPDTDVEVEVELRDHREQVWRVSLSGSGTGMELSAEDMGGA